MTSKEKLSYDFQTIERGLTKRDGKEDRLGKAVTQLLANIERCILLQLPLDKCYDPNAISIYPVIIVHDALYSAPALNYLFHCLFVDKLKKTKSDPRFKEYDFSRIHPLTIIEIDTLILYQPQFISKVLDLVDLIKLYHSHVQFNSAEKSSPQQVKEWVSTSALSFSEFVRVYANNNEIQINVEMLSEALRDYQ